MIKKEISEKDIKRVGALLDKLEALLVDDRSQLTKLANPQLVKAHVQVRDRLKKLVVSKNEQIKYYNEKKQKRLELGRNNYLALNYKHLK